MSTFPLYFSFQPTRPVGWGGNRQWVPTFSATKEEANKLFPTLMTIKENSGNRSRSQTVILKRGMNIKHLPYAFTEQGVAMLSSVLRSDRSVRVNIEIMRTFVRQRKMLTSNEKLSLKLADLEKRYDAQFKVVFDAIRVLMAPTTSSSKRTIGFTP